MGETDIDGGDPQDQAEAFDETHSTDELGYPDETRAFEPDLFDDAYDATAAQGDADEDDVALDADEYDPEDLDDSDTDEEDQNPLFLDDDFEDEDDLVEDEAKSAPDGFRVGRDEAEMTFVDNIDDATGAHNRVAQRYESSRELSDQDVRELGYAGRGAEEKTMGDKDKAPAPKAGPCADDVKDESHPRQEELLDEGVEETFPASDPVSVKHIT